MLKKLRLGRYSLPIAFWIFYALGSPIVFFSVAILTGLLGVYVPPLRVALFIFGLMIVWGYWLVASVGVWRSANNYQKRPRWRYAAKTVVAVAAILFALRLIDGGALTILSRIMGDWD